MAKASARRNGGGNGGATFGSIGEGKTGRYLVLLDDSDMQAGMKALANLAGIKPTVASGAESFSAGAVAQEQVLVLPELGVAVLSGSLEQVQRVSAASGAESTAGILAIEPERILYAMNEPVRVPAVYDSPFAPALPPAPAAQPMPIPRGQSVEYLRGYRDAVNSLIDGLLAGAIGAPAAAAVVAETGANTWGLEATQVPRSRYSGAGIKVAVLDTGVDLQHPDLQGRNIQTASFVEGQPAQDGHGHGTHCIGTSCGPNMPAQSPRYGIAYGADIYAGKVLGNNGSGAEAGILAGVDWAIRSGCQIISMSLGAPIQPGQPYSQVFESVARRALQKGTLIVAAAGNESYRPARVAAVGHPANCPSVLAVAAVDSEMEVASFSNGAINPNGGEVNIAAPGVSVYSTWPMPRRYNTISGTSMATPHVAGIAALWAQATGLTGLPLALRLLRMAQQLDLPVTDVGWGLVQAP